MTIKKLGINRYENLDNQYTDSKYAEFFTKTQPEVFKKSMFEQTWFKERFVDSIIKEFHVLKKDKRSELEVHLKPDFLGKILLKVSSENGRTIAKIITETIYAKDLLSTNFTELKDALREQGNVLKNLKYYLEKKNNHLLRVNRIIGMAVKKDKTFRRENVLLALLKM